MLGLIPPLIYSPFPKPLSVFYHNKIPSYFLLKVKTHKISQTPSRFIRFSNDPQNNNLTKEPTIGEEKQQKKDNESTEDDDLKKDRRPMFNFKWGDILNPDPDNILAIGFTGLLAWASAQVLWQLFFISSAILVAALKYSFIAALLIFILITLL